MRAAKKHEANDDENEDEVVDPAFDEDVSLMFQTMRGIATRALEQSIATVSEVEQLEPIPSWSSTNPLWRGELRMV